MSTLDFRLSFIGAGARYHFDAVVLFHFMRFMRCSAFSRCDIFRLYELQFMQGVLAENGEPEMALPGRFRKLIPGRYMRDLCDYDDNKKNVLSSKHTCNSQLRVQHAVNHMGHAKDSVTSHSVFPFSNPRPLFSSVGRSPDTIAIRAIGRMR